jgi:hypothetical protein
MSFDDAMDCIREDDEFETIRIEEPDLQVYKPLPVLQFVMPTMSKKTLIRPSKCMNLDKGTREDFSLKQFFFSDRPKDTDKMMTILKKRKVFISKPRLKQILDERKKKSFLNQMVFYDRYNDLLYFDGPTVSLVVSILFAILDYNHNAAREEDQLFMCFFRPLLQKQAALTTIQQQIRARLFRNKLTTKPVDLIIRKRAALCIQEWWRNLCLRKRVTALMNIKRHIS